MRQEAVYKIYLGLEEKAAKMQPARARLAQTVNRLQNGDYSQHPRLDPSGFDHTGKKKDYRKSLERAMKVTSRIKEYSLPKVNSGIEAPVTFKKAHFHEFPLSVQLPELRRQKGLSKADIFRSDGSGVGPGVYSFEKGMKPPSEKVVDQYARALHLSKKVRERLQEQRLAEIRERQMDVIRSRQQGEQVTFGDRLKALREGAGFSYKELGERTGLSPEVIFQIEHGSGDRATYEATLMRLWCSNTLPIPDDMMPQWFTNPQNMSEYLRSQRFRAGVTRAEFANRAGRHPTSIKASEDGRREPSVITIRLYEDILGIRVDFNKPEHA